MSRRIQAFIGVFTAGLLGAGLLGACIDLTDTLDGEPCTVEKDCWHKQDCARTADEELLGFPGVCAPKGTACVVGKQLGCSCVMGDSTTDCSSFALPFEVFFETYPKMVCDPTALVCVTASPEEMP